MSEEKTTKNPDWMNLAQEALSLWQDHLSSFASDPKAKSELSHLVSPMSRMFAEWMSVVQNGEHESNCDTENGQQDGGGEDKAPSPVVVAPAAGFDDMDELARRVAELKRQIDQLGTRNSAKSTAGHLSGKTESLESEASGANDAGTGGKFSAGNH